MKQKIYRAGTLPYYIDSNGILKFLFMKPANPQFGGEQFQIAKGKIEDGESDKKAALREAYEELGLLENNIVKLFKLGVYLGRTTIFIARVQDPENFIEPHFETGETRWFTPAEFKECGRFIHIPIILEAEDFVKTLDMNLV